MGTKQKPSRYDCYAKALPDEPMFVLLARDPNAPELVQEWARRRDLAISRGNRPETDLAAVEEAYDCAKAMYAWRKANDGRWRKQEPAPLTREQLIERLQWLATAEAGSTFPEEWRGEDGRWDHGMRQVAAAALALIPKRTEGGVNPDTLKSMVFSDRYEDALTPAGREEFERTGQMPSAMGIADADRGTQIEDPDPLATARSLVQQADYGRTSQAGAMAEWLIDPQGMAERQQQAGVPLEEPIEEDRQGMTRRQHDLMIQMSQDMLKRPLSPSSLLLPEVKP